MFAGLFSALAAAIALAFCTVVDRRFKTTEPCVLLFYHALGGLVLSAIFILLPIESGLLDSRLKRYTWRQIGISYLAATLDTVSLVCYTVSS